MTESLQAARIADVAIALADAEGLSAVSMRRVGAALGVSGMALYRHVADRDALVRAMIARIARGHAHAADADTGWRDTLHALAHATWRSFVAHPWLADAVVAPARLMDATGDRHTEVVLTRLTDAGLTPDRAADVFVTTAALVVGIARVTLTPDARRVVEYTVDERPHGVAPGPLTTHFRALPLDAARGALLVEEALSAYLDGVEASLATARAIHREES